MGYKPDGTWDWDAQDREEKKAAVKERNARMTAAEEERIKKQKIESANRARHRDGVMALNEYRRAGIEPLSLDADGYPTCPLSGLMFIGWTIEEIDGKKTLVKPEKKKRKRSAVG